MDVFEQGVFLDEEKARDVEEIFINIMMKYGTSSNQHGDVMVQPSNEEPYVF